MGRGNAVTQQNLRLILLVKSTLYAHEQSYEAQVLT
jgi:hypothetical protein